MEVKMSVRIHNDWIKQPDSLLIFAIAFDVEDCILRFHLWLFNFSLEISIGEQNDPEI